MPCDQVRVSSVDMQRMDLALLVKALEGLGHRVRVDEGVVSFDRHTYANGKLSLYNVSEREQADVVNRIKRAYAGEVVKSVSKKYGWNLKSNAANKYVAQRRG